jgi:serine/threonine protein kinase
MATVYLAHDLKHDRKVAIKVLHILPLLDSGKVESQGATFFFYVMPHVEGESLRERLVAAGGMGGRPGGRRARLPELPADALRLRALARRAAGWRRGGAGGGG